MSVKFKRMRSCFSPKKQFLFLTSKKIKNSTVCTQRGAFDRSNYIGNSIKTGLNPSLVKNKY
jgi:hypothetical protein